MTLTATGAADRLTITITDRGVGVAPADVPQIFDPYFTTKRGGTGLGLPIAKNIVEGLGGTIAVTSIETKHDAELGIADAGSVPQHRLNTGCKSPGELQITLAPRWSRSAAPAPQRDRRCAGAAR